MEIYVGVASTIDNMVPVYFGGEGNLTAMKFEGEGDLIIMRFELDTEDGTIYSRQTIRCNERNIADHIEENGIVKFVYNQMAAEIEEVLRSKGVKLYPGTTGKVDAAAKSAL